MKIWFGTKTNRVDVTAIAQSLSKSGALFIPTEDRLRTQLFHQDPLFGVLKSVFVTDIETHEIVLPSIQAAYIDWDNNKLYRVGLDEIPYSVRAPFAAEQKLVTIQKQLNLSHGTFEHEYPEQMMNVMFLKGHETVLEIGGNIGRNSLVIASILHDPERLLTLECDAGNFAMLKQNRDQNAYQFRMECAALSKRPLFQKGWDTSITPIDGWTAIPTMDYVTLLQRNPLRFDTLVLDCEGAFYYILRDMPEVLTGIHLVIMENDYNNIEEYTFVANALIAHGLKCSYSAQLGGTWKPCHANFYEVWTSQ